MMSDEVGEVRRLAHDPRCSAVVALETMAERLGLNPETLQLLERELRNSREKFPGNEHMLAALTEEVGEAAQALIEHGNGSEARSELVQVAAVALRIMEEGCGDFPSEDSGRAVALHAEDGTQIVGDGAMYWVVDIAGVTRVKLRRLESGWALVGDDACPERGRGPIWPVEDGRVLAPFYSAHAWHVNFAEGTLRPTIIKVSEGRLHAHFAGMGMAIPVDTESVFRTVHEAAKALEAHMERVGECSTGGGD